MLLSGRKRLLGRLRYCAEGIVILLLAMPLAVWAGVPDGNKAETIDELAGMFLSLGMHRGPLLAYLMADPELSLQSILITASIIGRPKAWTYCSLGSAFQPPFRAGIRRVDRVQVEVGSGSFVGCVIRTSRRRLVRMTHPTKEPDPTSTCTLSTLRMPARKGG